EMIAGRLPFDGANINETVASLLSDRELPPVARYVRDVPPEFERITHKALRKRREERYQHIGDLLLDLQSLRRRLAFETELQQSGGAAIEAAPLPSGISRRTRFAVLGISAAILVASFGYWMFGLLSAKTTIDSI